MIRSSGPMYVCWVIVGYNSFNDDGVQPGYFKSTHVLKHTVSGYHIMGWRCEKSVCVDYGDQKAAIILQMCTETMNRSRNLQRKTLVKLRLPQGSRPEATLAAKLNGTEATAIPVVSRSAYRDAIRTHWGERNENCWRNGEWRG